MKITRRRTVIVFFLLAVLSVLATTSIIPSFADLSYFNLMFLLSSDSPQFLQDLQLFSQSLESGDYLLIHGNATSVSTVLKQVQLAKSMVKPGVVVVPTIIYDKIADITKQVPTLPRGVELVFYDYENGTKFSPEFTTNETVSIGYFDQAENAVHQYNSKKGGNAKLLVAPSYGELKSAGWDWGLAAQHTDMIDVQFGGYTKSSALSVYAPQVVTKIRQESPNTTVFIQLSLMSGTPKITSDDIYTLDGHGVYDFLPWYNQTSSSHTAILQQFFSMLPRFVPQSPVNLTATAILPSQIILRWNAPSNSSHSDIAGYKIDRSTNNGTTWTTVTSNTNSNATSYTDAKLVHSTAYAYRVSTVNSMGPSPPSSTAYATTPNAVPQAPTGLAAVAVSPFRVNLSWTAPSDDGGSPILGYMVKRSINGTGIWSVISPNTGSNATVYSDAVSANTTYAYHIFAINSIGTGSRSNTAYVTTPPATSLLTVVSEDSVGNKITGYRTELYEKNGTQLAGYTPYNFTLYDGINYTIHVENNGTYKFSSWYDTGFTNANRTISISSDTKIIALYATAPDPPQNLTATAVSSSQVDLSWTAPFYDGGSPVTGYVIVRTMDNGSSWSATISSAKTNSVKYNDTGLEHSTNYTYKVSAINSIGTSQPSGPATARTFDVAPTAPVGLTATGKITLIYLKWAAPSDNGGTAITGYQIERSTDGGKLWSTIVQNTHGTMTSYSDPHLLPVKTCSYRVCAINAIGTGPPSNTASVAPLHEVLGEKVESMKSKSPRP